MKTIHLITLLSTLITTQAIATGSMKPLCYAGSKANDQYEVVFSKSQTELGVDLGTYFMEVTLTRKKVKYIETAVYFDEQEINLAKTFKETRKSLDFGVEDDGGSALVKGIGPSTIQIKGQKGYPMTLVREGESRYENQDSDSKVIHLTTNPVTLYRKKCN